MAKRTRIETSPHAFKRDDTWVARRDAFARSGAAGVHEDQKSRREGTGRTNRVGSRRAARTAAIRDGGW